MAQPGLAPRIGTLLGESLEAHASRTAFTWAEGVSTFGEIATASERLSARLERLCAGGLAGERVAVIAPNVPAIVVAMLAAWNAGAVVVPLSARLREYELAAILADAEASAVVSVDSYRGYSFAELLRRLPPQLPALRGCVLVAPTGEVDDELACDARERPEPLGAEIGAILYTSGTTGKPKGALVQHERAIGAARELGRLLELTTRDTCVQVVPISHAFGFECALTSLVAGVRSVLVDSTFTPGPMLRAIRDEHATIVHGSPALFLTLLKAAPEGLANVRAGFVGGGPSPPGMIQRLDESGTRILNLYGMTEIGAATCCRLNDPPDVRYETAGRPLPNYELRVADDGELQVRGPYVTPGYFRNPDQTAAAFTDAWFRTGDIGTLDEDGRLRITGRAKEVVHVGGFSVFPAEVEAFLLTHPDVERVVVVGVEHEKLGEALHAFVVRRSGTNVAAADLLRYARGQIADYKLPYAMTFVEDLPTLASGKPDRLALARTAAENPV